MKSIFAEALIFAAEKHDGQVRKVSNLPYIIHPITVATYILKYKSESQNIELLMTCALLHDLVEDCSVTLKEIAERFGYKIAAIVEELTKDETLIASIGKEEFWIRRMLSMSSYALCLKLCDLLHNSQEPEIKRDLRTVRLINHILKERELTDTQLKIITEITDLMNKRMPNEVQEEIGTPSNKN